MDLTSIGALITISAAGLVTVLAQIQKSKCKLINLCCGLVKCNRQIPDIELTELYSDNNEKTQNKTNQISNIQNIDLPKIT